MTYVKDMAEGMHIISHYFCQEKTMCRGKTGKDYISLTLRDKTGTVSAKIWDLTSKIRSFETGDFVKIEAMVTAYKGELQLNVSQIRRSETGEFDPGEYSPVTQKDIPTMLGEIDDWMRQVKNPYLNQILYMFYKENRAMIDKISHHPAAKSIHHSFIGGYLEHITSVTKIAAYLADQYRHINKELVITAAMLHDIGKLRELTPMPEAAYTLEGNLLGHITIGYEMVHDAIAQIPGFPKKLAVQLEHIMLAHHGELEFGSPKEPQTMEAFVVNLADNTDAKLKQLEEFIDKDTTPGPWTARNMIFARSLYKAENDTENENG